MTLIASHRGGALEFVENSPSAFLYTAGLAVDQVEFDIHPTEDGEVVVIHDATLERTTSGAGPVAAHSLAALKALTLQHTDGEAMLTLAELCALFAPTRITLRMEVKAGVGRRPYPGLLKKAVNILDSFDLRRRTVVTSFIADTVSEAAATPGLAGAIWLVAPDVQEYIGLGGIFAVTDEVGATAVGIRQNCLDGAVLSSLRSRGLSVGAWAVNDAVSIRRMLDLGVDVFTTDIPTQALDIRGDFRTAGI
jgi:glycerophosphoryl diester phosphodiesterase